MKKIRKHSFQDKEYKIRWYEPKDFDFPVNGCCSDPRKNNREIHIKPDQKEKILLEILIHEGIHASQWHTSEEYVDKTGKDLADFLWKIGFRLKK
jgi:hypothetical protein